MCTSSIGGWEGEGRDLPVVPGHVKAGVRVGGTFPAHQFWAVSAPSKHCLEQIPAFSAALGRMSRGSGSGVQGGQGVRHPHCTLGLAPMHPCRCKYALPESVPLQA